MDQRPPPIPLKPNPVTFQRHRKEVLLQITLPLIIGVTLLCLGMLAVLGVGLGPGGSLVVSQTADISLIWLILIELVMTTLFLLVLAGIAILLVQLIRILPGYTHQLQKFFLRVQLKTSSLADKSVEPIVKIKSFFAGGRALRRR